MSRTRCSALRAAPQRRDPLRKELDPGSAAHRRSRATRDPERAAQHPGNETPEFLIPAPRPFLPFAILLTDETALPSRRAGSRQADGRKSAAGDAPGRLFDNHAAIDLARTLFDFGAPGFWELVHSVRCSALDAAAAHGVALVVTTFCYANPDDRPQYQDFEAIMRRHGGELLPVFLHCSREEAARRVGNPDRVERRKMSSAESLIKDLDRYNFSPVPRPDCLKLDTEVRSAEATAREIVSHFGL